MRNLRVDLRRRWSRRSTVLALPVLLLASSAALALVLAAGAAPTGTSPDEATWQLTIEASDGSGTSERFTLSCPDGAGQHPDPAGACALLSGLTPTTAPLAPVSPDAACTMIYGGPDTATLTGTYRGQAVRFELSRTDGCQMARFDALAVLLGR
jgi:hypothetical protein